ncbi:MAG TPA: hypothetical protein ENI52_01425 [Thermoplasmata archaeon]|nr:hypothetical protein [Thermoplasmata archaeon]
MDKIRKEVKQIEKENKSKGKPLSTLLNEAKGKNVRVFMMDGEILKGRLEKFSLYEIQIDNKIIWKQAIKYIEMIE